MTFLVWGATVVIALFVLAVIAAGIVLISRANDAVPHDA